VTRIRTKTFSSRNLPLHASATAASVQKSETKINPPTNADGPINSNSNIISWDDLHELLPEQEQTEANAPLVLYRDTNGWCPFCERVWLALEIKQIPYQEQLINLQDKPTWFTQMVPTGLVPAVLFPSGDSSTNVTTERTLMWESLDILKALDERFSDTPKLIHDDNRDYQEAREIVTQASSAGVRLLYGGRNQTVTAEEKELKRRDFSAALSELDLFLGTKHAEGPFCLGKEVTGVDVEMVPVLERWRYQLPITANMQVYDESAFPNLYTWYNAMDQYAPYKNRVSGDAYSWTAVASTFLRLFSTGPNGTTSEETHKKIERADRAAKVLTGSFSVSTTYEDTPAARTEAAAKLVSNHKAIVADATNADPKSQKQVTRATDAESADAALRATTHSLLSGKEPNVEVFTSKQEAATAARTVAARLCVPRDMGAPAAHILRKTLTQLADKLEK
jgi:glutathione S-transferase